MSLFGTSGRTWRADKGGEMNIKDLIEVLEKIPEDSRVEGEWAVVHGPLGVEKVKAKLTIYVGDTNGLTD